MNSIRKTVNEFEKCTGCKACGNICTNNAINYKYDDEGFIKPDIDIQKCNECGRCLRECPQINHKTMNRINEIYAIRIKNFQTLRNSTSGGAFYVLAKKILNNGGVVVGCILTDTFKVEHIMINNVEDLSLLQGSKYVQSDTKSVFSEIKEKLDSGVQVVFSGTPCQVAGLNTVLKKEYENLFTIDIICHGVPSLHLFQSYIRWLEYKHSKKVVSYKFRYNDNSWGLPYRSYIKLSNGSIITDTQFDPYLKGFINGDFFCKACYECKYKSENRNGDITIGDFWTHKSKKYIYDGKGVSFLSTNTEKGKKLFEQIQNDIIIYEHCDNPTAKDFYRFKRSTENIPEHRNEIYKNINNRDLFDKMLRTSPSFKNYFVRYMPTKITLNIKRVISRFTK